MTSPSTDMTDSLVIQEKERFQIESYQVEVLSYLSQSTTGVYYFKVNIESTEDSTTIDKLGLLRVGSVESGLSRELSLREALGGYKMIAELLASTTKEPVLINTQPPLLVQEQEEDGQNKAQDSAENVETKTDSTEAPTNEAVEPNTSSVEALPHEAQDEQEPSSEIYEETSGTSSEAKGESDYLEEEYYPEKEISPDSSHRKLILLTYLPDEQSTLETWLKEDHHSYEESLSLAIQVCQCFFYISQRQWCFTDILPQLIEMGKPIKFFDLTNAYPVGEKFPSGLIGDYCALELAYGNPFHESMSSYTVGALLYQAIHQQLPRKDQNLDIKITPIPRIYQLLKICLSPIPEERFPLSQLLSLLIEARKSFGTTKINWEVASKSTVGLSTSRLQNEDSYGVRQQQLSNSETMILGVVADGMGGMAQGEVASKLAVQTALEEPILSDFKAVEQRANWLVSLFQKANNSIAKAVRDGGTTLSLVLAIGREVMVAHVGDSRIYLLRQGEIRQLSEDHSLVAMMVASEQITQEESLNHPDRNVLTKSLGSKRGLSDGYVQDLSRTGEGLSMTLEDGDLLLLCSDGVWDLISAGELAEIFKNHQSLQSAVDETIVQVLNQGASDNATILALQLSLDFPNYG